MKVSSVLPRPAERAALLIARQRLKMAGSVHAYVRGNTGKFTSAISVLADADGEVEFVPSHEAAISFRQVIDNIAARLTAA